MPVSKGRRKAVSKKKEQRRVVQKRRATLKKFVSLATLLDAEESRLVEETLDDAVDPRPCKGENSNICVAEGCYNQSCVENVKEA